MGFKNNTEIVLHELNTVLDKIDSAVINQVIEIINGSDKVFFTALGRAGSVSYTHLDVYKRQAVYTPPLVNGFYRYHSR